MGKLMKIPFYIPLLGIVVSFALFFIDIYIPNDLILIPGLILFHISGWFLAARFFLSGVGFFSTVLNTK
jgi:hypothetical protein